MGALYFALLVDFLVAVAECLADAASGTKGVYCDTLNPSLGGGGSTHNGRGEMAAGVVLSAVVGACSVV